jgi:hypothetical protein
MAEIGGIRPATPEEIKLLNEKLERELKRRRKAHFWRTLISFTAILVFAGICWAKPAVLLVSTGIALLWLLWDICSAVVE